MKNTLLAILASTVLSSNLYSAEHKLPVDDSTITVFEQANSQNKLKLDKLAESYELHIKDARKLFNQSIMKKVITYEDRDVIMKAYDRALTISKNALAIADSTGLIKKYGRVFSFPKADQNLYTLIQTCNYQAIEGYLREEGIAIEVRAR